ncbi:MAG: hypothetical protein U0414_40785 [Polyangiaceae bacterium]
MADAGESQGPDAIKQLQAAAAEASTRSHKLTDRAATQGTAPELSAALKLASRDLDAGAEILTGTVDRLTKKREAEAKAASQTKDTDDALKRADQMHEADSRFRFMQYGVTIGVAYTVHVPLAVDPSFVDVGSVKGSAMPFVAIAPGYWFSRRDARRKFCALQWSASEATAEKAAKGEDEKASTAGTKVDPNDLDVYNCWAMKVGLYAGLPLAYDASVFVDRRSDPRETIRSVTPVFSGGLAILPTALVSVLAGVGASFVSRDDKTETTVLSLDLSVASNIDVITALFR